MGLGHELQKRQELEQQLTYVLPEVHLVERVERRDEPNQPPRGPACGALPPPGPVERHAEQVRPRIGHPAKPVPPLPELEERVLHQLDDGTGGTVKAGAVCYLSARVDEPRQVTGDDSPIYPYVVVLWTHDGSGALQARRTSVRPVCWNTINLGEAEARRSGRNFTFRHTKNVLVRIEEAKRVIAGAREETAAFVELANELWSERGHTLSSFQAAMADLLV